jgi:hypothetical protein
MGRDEDRGPYEGVEEDERGDDDRLRRVTAFRECRLSDRRIDDEGSGEGGPGPRGIPRPDRHPDTGERREEARARSLHDPQTLRSRASRPQLVL